MKQLKCEMCGSTDLVKQDGLFVCQSCGCKYSTEEAKKLMVELSGTVKIDKTEETQKLYVLARRARDSGDRASALKNYNKILQEEPQSWEAYFYSSAYQVEEFLEADNEYNYNEKKYNGLIKNLQNGANFAFEQIKASDVSDDEKYSTLQKVVATILDNIVDDYDYKVKQPLHEGWLGVADKLTATFGDSEKYASMAVDIKVKSYRESFFQVKSDEHREAYWEALNRKFPDKFDLMVYACEQKEVGRGWGDYQKDGPCCLIVTKLLQIDSNNCLANLTALRHFGDLVNHDPLAALSKAANGYSSLTDAQKKYIHSLVQDGTYMPIYFINALKADNLTVVKFLLECGVRTSYNYSAQSRGSFFEEIPTSKTPNGEAIIRCLLQYVNKEDWINQTYTIHITEKSYYDLIKEKYPDAKVTYGVLKRKKSGGCYIATAVYGSYNCPEVWVLRRYRDNKLDENVFGKLFIKIYYAISPTVVKLFGKKQWFNTYWRKRLDKKVARLRSQGFEDTPYDDKY